MNNITLHQCTQRVYDINKKLKEKGLTWEEIENFWDNVFTFCEGLGMKKITKVKTFKIEGNGNNLHSNG